MKQYDVTGMSCAACSARVEKAVSQVPGVTACSVSLLTNSMGVEGNGLARGHRQGRGGGGLRRGRKGRGQGDGCRRRLGPGGPGDAGVEAAAPVVGGLSGGADVLLHGPYDGRLARSGLFRGQPRGPGAGAAAAGGHRHGHQSEVFYLGLPGPVAPGPQYGYPGGPGLHGGLCL